MIKTTQSSRAAQQRFRELCEAANKQAFEFSSGRIDPWEPRVWWRSKAMWSVLAICGAMAITTIAAQLATGSSPDPAVAVSTATPPMATRSIDPRPAPPAGLAPVQPMRWVERQLLVDIEQGSLADASRQLAEVTGTALIGAESLPPTTLVTLHGRFGDIPSAWHRLLKGEVLYSVDCTGVGACRVAITGSVPVHPALEKGLPTPPPPEPPVLPPRKQLPGEAESQPGGAC